MVALNAAITHQADKCKADKYPLGMTQADLRTMLHEFQKTMIYMRDCYVDERS